MTEFDEAAFGVSGHAKVTKAPQLPANFPHSLPAAYVSAG
jgi:hypothetical protein